MPVVGAPPSHWRLTLLSLAVHRTATGGLLQPAALLVIKRASQLSEAAAATACTCGGRASGRVLGLGSEAWRRGSPFLPAARPAATGGAPAATGVAPRLIVLQIGFAVALSAPHNAANCR